MEKLALKCASMRASVSLLTSFEDFAISEKAGTDIVRGLEGSMYGLKLMRLFGDFLTGGSC